jgi:hypothetical protein
VRQRKTVIIFAFWTSIFFLNLLPPLNYIPSTGKAHGMQLIWSLKNSGWGNHGKNNGKYPGNRGGCPRNVPEPATMLLMTSGIAAGAGYLVIRHRKRKK